MYTNINRRGKMATSTNFQNGMNEKIKCIIKLIFFLKIFLKEIQIHIKQNLLINMLNY